MFYGRKTELQLLNDLYKKQTASMVICRGRRRIGKSRLIQEFGKSAQFFYEFQGIPPRENITKKDQINSFADQMGNIFNEEPIPFQNWTQAFTYLSSKIKNHRTVILFDEISWMAHNDMDFAGTLKIAWDTDFKKHNELIFIICGSVTSWIDKNILNNTGFVGRISLTLTPQELELHYCNHFWGSKKKHISSFEKLKLLSVIGGVPRYLEEINPSISAEENIKKLCFQKEGLLFSEFDKIFNDIFSKRAPIYKKILESISSGHRTFTSICKYINVPNNGVISEYLHDLETAGFVSHDKVWSLNNKVSGLSKYRLKDNYIRFYLKYIYNQKDVIEKDIYKFKSLDNLQSWTTTIGLQFENLVLNNLTLLIPLINIPFESVLNASPYFQNETKRLKKCQIDLLIQTKHSIYVCEIKFKQSIGINIIDEINEKINRLKIKRNISVRKVLILEGELSSNLKDENYFDYIIPFGELLTSDS